MTKKCVRCPKVGRDPANDKYTKHPSYCQDCIREYNANRYRKGSSLKDFFPEMRNRIVEIRRAIVTQDTSSIKARVADLELFLDRVESDLPGIVKDKESGWKTRKGAKEAEVLSLGEEREREFDLLMNQYARLIKTRQNLKAGEFLEEHIEPRYPDALDRGWEPIGGWDVDIEI